MRQMLSRLFSKKHWFLCKLSKTRCQAFFISPLLAEHSAAFICSGGPLTYCRNAHLYSTLKQSIVHDLCADIDVDQIKADCSIEDGHTSLAEIVKAEVQTRLDVALKELSGQESRLLKIVQLEHSFLFSEGYAIPAPDCLTSKNWLEAMTMSTMEDRLVYYCNLERNATKTGNRPGTPAEQVTSKPVGDGENKHSIVLDLLSPEQEERCFNHRLASAMLHGSTLVVDLGYDESHLSTEIDPLVAQLWGLFLVNRKHREPFHLVFTNCNFSGPVYRHLLLSCMVKSRFVLATFTEKSHTEIFHKQDLVYLSSQSKESLLAFSPNDIYVLGAYNDPLVHKKLSYAKAKGEKLRCLRLPIDQHVKWTHQAHKDLDLDSMTGILLSVKDDGLWKKAFIDVIPSLINLKS